MVLQLQITNKAQTRHIYTNTDGSAVRLTDEKGNDFEWCRARVKPEPGSVLAQELEAAPKRPMRFRDEAVTYHVDPTTWKRSSWCSRLNIWVRAGSSS